MAYQSERGRIYRMPTHFGPAPGPRQVPAEAVADPTHEAPKIEREIADAIAAVKVRLRFDRAVLRLVAGLKATLATVVPEDQTIIFTVTAPIKLPAKTAAALESVVRGGLPQGDLHTVVNGNKVRVRRVTGIAAYMPRVIGFVHNRESDADLILAVAESRLLERI